MPASLRHCSSLVGGGQLWSTFTIALPAPTGTGNWVVAKRTVHSDGHKPRAPVRFVEHQSSDRMAAAPFIAYELLKDSEVVHCAISTFFCSLVRRVVSRVWFRRVRHVSGPINRRANLRSASGSLAHFREGTGRRHRRDDFRRAATETSPISSPVAGQVLNVLRPRGR